MQNDIVDKFSTHLKDVLTRALCVAAETNQKMIQPEHLLYALGTQHGCIAEEALKKSGVKTSELKKLISIKTRQQTAQPAANVNLCLSDDAKRIVEKAVLTANVYGHRYVGTEHLLSGILQINAPTTKTFFEKQKIDMKELGGQLTMVLKSTSKFPELANAVSDNKNLVTATPAGEQIFEPQNDKKQSALEFFSVELTSNEAQKRIDPVIGRDDEIERLMEILTRRIKNNPLLLGEPGVGKTAIVEGLAKQITQGNVPSILAHKRIFALDMTLVISGTMYRGEFENRLRQILEEVKQNPDFIIFIDELHNIVGAGAASGSMDAANILKPALSRGEIRCIGATTPCEYKKHIESDSALERRFQTVFVNEPSKEKALEILEGIAPYYEKFHRVSISHEALKDAVNFADRYIQDRHLPDKAIDLIDEAAAATRLHSFNPGPLEQERSLNVELEKIRHLKRQAVVEEQFQKATELKEQEEIMQMHLEATRSIEDTSPVPIIRSQDIARVISRATGIPVDDLIKQERVNPAMFESQLASDVIGQTKTIKTVTGAIMRAKTGVAHPKRPLASFLFLGPSGVGKTELAKSISRLLFHTQDHLIRLDMSEYSEGFTMSKLIGAPAGYVGYKDSANLTDRVKQRPYCVVLFDEIEKAHRDVQNLLLQILEEGELTDATGRKVNFKNTIIILTSNIGLERFERGEMGFINSDNERADILLSDLEKELSDRFRPELVNRIDHICVFESLLTQTLLEIAIKQMSELKARLSEQGINIEFGEDIAELIVGDKSTKAGARNIRSQIQKHIEHKIAELIGKIGKQSRLRVSRKGKNIIVTKF